MDFIKLNSNVEYYAGSSICYSEERLLPVIYYVAPDQITYISKCEINGTTVHLGKSTLHVMETPVEIWQLINS